MNIEEYQAFTPSTFISHGHEIDLNHVTNGLFAEAGEVAAAYQKYYRGDYDESELLERVQKELGGLMYYAAQLCNIEGLSLSNILTLNKSILEDRQRRGVIQGDGDVR